MNCITNVGTRKYRIIFFGFGSESCSIFDALIVSRSSIFLSYDFKTQLSYASAFWILWHGKVKLQWKGFKVSAAQWVGRSINQNYSGIWKHPPLNPPHAVTRRCACRYQCFKSIMFLYSSFKFTYQSYQQFITWKGASTAPSSLASEHDTDYVTHFYVGFYPNWYLILFY